MSNISIVHYWGGRPLVRTPRLDWHHAILKKCHQKGWRTIVVFSSAPQNDEIQQILKKSNIECLYLPRPERQFDFRCIYDSYRLFKDIKCTIAHLHCVHTSPIIGSFLAGVPVRIWSCHSSEYRDDGQTLSWIHRFGISTRITCALSHKILPVSKSIKKELLRHGVQENRISVAPIPIEVELYSERLHSREFMRKSFGFTENEILVCSVGRGIYRKGWDVLIRAFAQTVVKFPQMRLLLIGSMTSEISNETDAYQKTLLQLVDELKISDKVNFLGVRKDVADILSSVDIFAFPSRAEGLPIALLEAMAAGLPCIASTVGGIPEVIKNEESGLIVESEDVDALANGLTRLASDEKLRIKLSEKSLISLETFSLEYQVESIIKLYDKLLAERGFAD